MVILFPWLLLKVQASSITLTFPPTPAPKALEMLSAASGRTLLAAPALEDEVVLARLKDASIDVALSHLAEVLCAKWERKKDGITWLVPDPAAIRRLDQAEAAETEKHLLNGLKALQTKLAQQPEELDQAAVDAYQKKKAAVEKQREAAAGERDFRNRVFEASYERESPAWRTLVRLVTAIGPKALLAMPNDSREVWAENPTPMQHAFPDSAQVILARYRRELALLNPSSTVARVEVRAKSWDQKGTRSFDFAGLDSSGKPIDKVNDFATVDPFFGQPINLHPIKDFPQIGELALPTPPEAAEARIALSRAYMGPDRASILEKWRPKLLDPVHNEPTQWHVGEDLVLAAEATGRNLIGTVNDRIDASSKAPEKLAASQVLSRHAEDLLPSTDGWLVVRSHERTGRAARSKAMAVLTQCAKQGGLSLDNAAEWQRQSGLENPFLNWMEDDIRALYSGLGRYNGMATMSEGYQLQLWASLGSGIIDSLKHGEKVPFSKLPSAAIDQISRFVYWYEFADGENSESTDWQPNGITDGEVTMSVVEKQVLYGWPSKDGPPATPWFMDAKVYGTSLATGPNGPLTPPDDFMAYDRYRLGVNRAYTLDFVVHPSNRIVRAVLRETLFDPNLPVLTELPDSIKSETEQARLDAIAHPRPRVRQRQIPPE